MGKVLFVSIVHFADVETASFTREVFAQLEMKRHVRSALHSFPNHCDINQKCPPVCSPPSLYPSALFDMMQSFFRCLVNQKSPQLNQLSIASLAHESETPIFFTLIINVPMLSAHRTVAGIMNSFYFISLFILSFSCSSFRSHLTPWNVHRNEQFSVALLCAFHFIFSIIEYCGHCLLSLSLCRNSLRLIWEKQFLRLRMRILFSDQKAPKTQPSQGTCFNALPHTSPRC